VVASFSELSPAFILHYRKYRDTSLIFDLFTQNFGRFSAVARGALGAKPRFKGLLQPFVPLLVSYYGAGELKSVKNVDFYAPPIHLSGYNLLIGLYVNELLIRLLGTYDPLEKVYQSYARLVTQLEKSDDVEPLLRRFEIMLLSELGYGISFGSEVTTGREIVPEENYTFEAEHGFVAAGESQGFKGSHILSINNSDFSQEEVKIVAKQVVRLALQPLLGNKPLNSRILFARR
jgi:DNA repair protein RecO (recombination protein O)